ncbi:family 16 glycosylhydrolase [Polaribacter pectinis]|uniref:Family 16 glycosylhydrolase n=1 Tax=Polaribacter pectinis TaxID=2738844 RepID=A0A7G9L6S4_9FLAO|nr:family 16 glycosylhydrolase [Polaribacter pectinis]QNM84323.1 family 16 glycosylhydrolase [Polaribacter pectinis]
MKEIRILILLLTVSISVNGQELITNGGFETGDFTGWTTNNCSIQANPATGAYNSNLKNSSASIKQTVTVVPGTLYNVSFKYRTFTGTATIDINATIKNNVNDAIIATSPNFDLTATSYITETFSFTPATGVTSVYFEISKGYDASGNNAIKLDDVSIINDGYTPPPVLIDPDTAVGQLPFGSVPGSWELEFSDEFNGSASPTPNTDRWVESVSANSRAPRPFQGVDDWWWRQDHVSVNGSGQLELKASKFDSNTMYCGSVETIGLYEPTYGYFEARIEIANTQKGNHTAFWMQGHNQGNVNDSGADGAELDFFESAWITNKTKAVVHYDGYGSDHMAYTVPYNTPNIHSGYHTFGAHWTSTTIDIYYDGVKVTSTSINKPFPFSTDPANGNPLVPQVPEWLWLSVGASFGDGTFNLQPIGDLSVAKVDWVRAYKSVELPSSNIVTNGDFETGERLPWNNFNNQVINTDDIRPGNQMGNIDNNEGSFSQILEVTPGVSYNVSFDYRWVSGAGNYDMIPIIVEGVSGATNITTTPAVPTLSTTPDSWHTSNFSFTAPSGVFNARILLNKLSGNRPIRVDNVSITVAPDKTWNGSTDTNWSTPTNWAEGTVPTTSEVVYIPSGLSNYPTLTSNVTVGQLIINSGASFIATGFTVTGGVSYYTSIADDKWHLIAPPVSGQVQNNNWVNANGIVSGTGNNKGISTYSNGTLDPTTGSWRYFTGTGSTFDTGIGYSMKKISGGLYTFSGTIPSGTQSVTITQDVSNWNLVGNPFPSYLLVSDIIGDNTNNLTGTHQFVYVWDNNKVGGAGYTTLSGTDYIHPGQAFFVNAANSNANNFSITEARQKHKNNVLFYRNSLSSIKLFITDSNQNIEYTEIEYKSNATKALDKGLDAGTFTGVSSNFNIYSHLVDESEGVNFMKQVLPDSDLESMVIPIGITADAGKEITFSAEVFNLQSDLKVFLEDKLNKTFTHLDKENANYTVTLSEAVSGIGRFYIHTAKSSLSINDTILENASIYKINSTTLRIVGLPQGVANVKLFNILGEQMINTTFKANGNQDVSLPKLAKGVYVVQLITATGKLNKKIVLE